MTGSVFSFKMICVFQAAEAKANGQFRSLFYLQLLPAEKTEMIGVKAGGDHPQRNLLQAVRSLLRQPRAAELGVQSCSGH